MGPKRSGKSKGSTRQKIKEKESPSPKSPKVSAQKREPLSDVARRVKDCCVTWAESVQKWQTLNSSGLETAKKYVNLRLQRQYSDNSDNTGIIIMSDCSKDDTTRLEEELCRTSEQFVKLEEDFTKLFEKMKTLNGNFESVRDLEDFKAKKSPGKQIEPLFHTWTAEKFVQASKSLLQMYCKELALKKKLIFSMFTETERHSLMYSLAAWLHEPYVEKDFLMESMFVETGLR